MSGKYEIAQTNKEKNDSEHKRQQDEPGELKDSPDNMFLRLRSVYFFFVSLVNPDMSDAEDDCRIPVT